MEDSGQIDVTELCRHMLLANLLQRKLKQGGLVNTSQIAGSFVPINDSLGESNLIYLMHSNSDGHIRPTIIRPTNEARAELLHEIPILEFLSFNSYRLVGGSCLQAVRAHDNGVNHSDHVIDADLFLLLGEISDPLQRDIKCKAIYANVLQEIDRVYQRHYCDTHRIFVVKNTGCTTIHLVAQRGRDQFRKRIRSPYMKLQIVHRGFETELQMLQSADLIPSQILYNGAEFYCTYPASLALRTNMFPVDISSTSCSMSTRLYKYVEFKNFAAVLVGMDRITLLDYHKTTVKTPGRQMSSKRAMLLPIGLELAFDLDNVLSYWPRIPRANARITIQDILDKSVDGYGIKGLDLKANLSDYDDDWSNKITPGALAGANLKALVQGRLDMICVYQNSIGEFLQRPLGTEVDKTFSKVLSIHNDLPRNKCRTYFGQYATQAIVAHLNEDNPTYYQAMNKRLAEIAPVLQKKFDQLREVTWVVENPGRQGSLKPLVIPASSFYTDFDAVGLPCFYNGFICTPAWKVKMTIIAAWRRRDANCLLVQLPRDILKHIFFLFDLDYLVNSRIAFEQQFNDVLSFGKTKLGPGEIWIRDNVLQDERAEADWFNNYGAGLESDDSYQSDGDPIDGS